MNEDRWELDTSIFRRPSVGAGEIVLMKSNARGNDFYQKS
jgi:hypothetical protein